MGRECPSVQPVLSFIQLGKIVASLLQFQMIGPHYERLAQIQQKMTAKQMLERIRNRPENPLNKVIEKLKKEFSEYETAYSDPIMDHQITSMDRILSFDSKLGPILDALEKQNVLLRKELGTLQAQLSNTVSICEQIVKQNVDLKLIIKGKNQDIGKIIETIAGNQAQDLNELQQKNSLLIRENSILMTHLEEVKKKHEEYSDLFNQHDQEQRRMQAKIEEMKKQLADSIGRERELSRKMTLLEQTLYQNNEELYQLRQSHEALTFDNNQLKNQLHLAQEKDDGSSFETIKNKLQAEYSPIVEEHRLLKRERTQLLRESEKLKLQNQKLQDAMSRLERQLYKANGDLQMTSSLLHQQKVKNATLQSNLNKIEAKLTQLKQENIRLKTEKETSSNYALSRQKRLLQEIDELRKNLDDKQGEVEGRIKQISRSMQNLLQSKDGEIKNLREENLHLQRLVERR